LTSKTVTTDKAVESVVTSFTQAELALAEMKNAVAAFASASDQLASAEETAATATASMSAATSAIGDATAAMLAVSSQLERAVADLGIATELLRKIEPDRLWTHLREQVARDDMRESQRLADNATISRQVKLILRIASAGMLAAFGSFALSVALALGLVPA
jgi:hypothetical protein